jgi:hypothetical protein
MKHLFLKTSLILFFITPAVNAAQFESVIDAMAIKSSASASYTNNGWEDTSKIKGVKWKWPYHESGAHDSTMVGKTKVGKDKNPNVGATEIKVNGARTFITDIQISISNESLGIEAFGIGKASKIKTSCDDDSASNSVEFYKFEKPGYKPLYISYQSSSGASGAGGVDMKVSYELDDALGIYSTPCTVLK